MKKILFSVFLAMFAFQLSASDADLLVWNIDLAESWVYQDGNYPAFNNITFGLQNGSDTTTFIDLKEKTHYLVGDTALSTSTGYGPGLTDTGAAEGSGIIGNFATDLSDYSNDVYGGYEVLIQLYFNDELVAVSDNIFDSSKHFYLRDLARTTITSDELPVSAWDIGINLGSHVVPEPTSGLLMMMGAGLLALRRRRRA